MKMFTKIASAIATFMLILGLVCVGAAFAMGLTWGEFVDMVEEGKFSIKFGDSSNSSSNAEAQFDAECERMEIEVGAGSLEIFYDDVDQIQVEQNGAKGYKAYMDGKTLHIEGGSSVGINQEGMSINVILPRSMKLKEVELELGAGEADIEELCVEKGSIEVGAGQATFIGLDVQELQAEVGVGQLYIELVGKESDFNLSMECGIGEIQIGDSAYGGFGNEQVKEYPGVSKKLDLECGLGQIQIDFTE